MDYRIVRCQNYRNYSYVITINNTDGNEISDLSALNTMLAPNLVELKLGFKNSISYIIRWQQYQ